MDKNQATIDFLLQCDEVRNNPLFFNFITAKEDNKQFITVANDKSLNRTYIDGSVLRQYTFTIIDYKSVSMNALVTVPGYKNENVEDVLDVQGIIDWITEQAELKNFPDFGEGYTIQSMEALTDNPNLNGIDSSTSPALAKYSFTIRIQYLDETKMIWTKEDN